MNNKNTAKTAHAVGGVLAIVGALLCFFDFGVAKYVFAVGVALLIVVQVAYLKQSKEAPLRIRRIGRLMFTASLLLGVGAYLMFVDDDRWVILLLIYAVISAFLALRAGKVG